MTRTQREKQDSDRASSVNKLLGILVYFAVVLAPSVTALLIGEVEPGNEFLKGGICISGVTTFSILCLQFVLAARLPWVVNTYGESSVFRFHKIMAVVASVLLLVHVVLLIWSRGEWGILLSPRVSWPIQAGRIAAVSILVTIGLAFCRKLLSISYDQWFVLHNILAWLVLILGFVHSFVMGTSLENVTFSYIWTSYFSVAALAWVWRRMSHLDNPR